MGTVFTIPAREPFVDALARGLLDEAANDPLTLADGLVLLPTRRACRSLQDAFIRQGGGRALLLPQIQPLGDVDPDELIGPAAGGVAAPPAIGLLRRQLLLSRLLAPVEEHLPHRLRLAAELALLLDELQTEGVGLDAVTTLVPDELAEHWRRTRGILEILGHSWPSILDEEGAVDPATRRDLLLRDLAGRLREGSRRRVVAAGTTGSIPATRTLLGAILALPGGTVVLPGLDTGLDDTSWALLPPTHAQAGLKQLLQALGTDRSRVALWPGARLRAGQPDRLPLLREAMRPAAAMAEAPDPRPLAGALASGLTIHELPDQAAEALVLALRMREALETPGRSAALVTPDRALARRVRVELRRFGLEVDDSAGTPLDRTPAGTFLLLIARLLSGVAPVPLLALLKHPLTRLSDRAERIRDMVRELERTCLRGPHVAHGFSGILAELTRVGRERADEGRKRQRIDRLHGFVTRVEETLRPLLDQAGRTEVALGDLLAAHVAVAETLATPAELNDRALWADEDGEAAADLCEEVHAAGDFRLPPGAYAAFLAELMAARPVRRRATGHPRLAILGQLEARLQQADLILVGGMNDGVWPGPVDSGPWLNRTMREELGLAPIERRIGLAAHDVQQLLAAPEVVVTRAERDAGGNPTVASRWLVRLRALLGPQRAADLWLGFAAKLDQPDGPTRPVDQPRPQPPLAARPRELSVSDVGSWMRDPYALYAKRILKLKPLESLEADPGALERGIMIHDVLEAFVRAYPDELPPDALRRLLDLGVLRFEEFAHRPQVRALWRPRFEQAARWFLEQERARRPELGALLVEVEGRLEIESAGGPFALKARADRIERGRDGGVTIIDYKTGKPPDERDVTGGRQPQLPLEAWIFLSGAFSGLSSGEVESLQFWSLRGDVQGGLAKPLKQAPADLAAAAATGLQNLIAHYDDETTSYPARLRPDMSYVREYDHLARFKEWAG
jgi:ATP-dependent helicase/nuclease subunit B